MSHVETNPFLRVHIEADKAIAEKWAAHKPLTPEQLDGLRDLMHGAFESGARRTHAVYPSSDTEWIRPLTETNALERLAIRNILTDAVAHPSRPRIRTALGVLIVEDDRPTLPLRIVERKFCPECGQHKEVCDFSLNRARRDGYDTYCTPCRREINAESYRKKAA